MSEIKQNTLIIKQAFDDGDLVATFDDVTKTAI